MKKKQSLRIKQQRLVAFQTKLYEPLRDQRKQPQSAASVAGLLDTSDTWLLDRIMDAAEEAVGGKHPMAWNRSKHDSTTTPQPQPN